MEFKWFRTRDSLPPRDTAVMTRYYNNNNEAVDRVLWWSGNAFTNGPLGPRVDVMPTHWRYIGDE